MTLAPACERGGGDRHRRGRADVGAALVLGRADQQLAVHVDGDVVVDAHRDAAAPRPGGQREGLAAAAGRCCSSSRRPSSARVRPEAHERQRAERHRRRRSSRRRRRRRRLEPAPVLHRLVAPAARPEGSTTVSAPTPSRRAERRKRARGRRQSGHGGARRPPVTDASMRGGHSSGAASEGQRDGRLGRLDDQHGAGRVVRDGVRHAAEHLALHPLVADHEQVGVVARRELDQDLGGIALARLARPAQARAPRRAPRSRAASRRRPRPG